MSLSGHLRELKEVSSLPHFLTELSQQMQRYIRFVAADGTIMFDAGDIDINPCCENVERDLQKYIAQMGEEIDSDEFHIVPCTCGKDLLLCPIRAGQVIDGILVVCLIADEQQLFLSVAQMICSHLALARNAVQKTKQAFSILDVHEEFFRNTESLTKLEDFYNATLKTLLIYINAEAGIFLPRRNDGSQWDEPFYQTQDQVIPPWLSQLATWVVARHETAHWPTIITVDNATDDPNFQQLAVTAFISSTLYYEGKVLGILVFCSQNMNTPSFGDLELLESLKGIISLRLHNLHYRWIKENFLQNAFHSMKGPTHSIIGLVDLISTDIEIIPLHLRQNLIALEQQAKRMLRLAQQAPMLANSGKPISVKSEISLAEIIVEVTTIYRIIAQKAKNVSILSDVPSNKCNIIGSRDELCEVLENLLDNSLKVLNKNEVIHVKLEVEAAVYRVSVVDEGPGVPENQREIIFHEFVSIPRTGFSEGSGLGLSIARNIVESHGGSLTYVDPTSGYGACFQFTVPKINVDKLGGEKQDARTHTHDI